MKNTAGLPYLDMVEVKHRDKAFKQAKDRARLRSKQYYKQLIGGYHFINEDHYKATEDVRDV